jgi:hypothetical protein
VVQLSHRFRDKFESGLRRLFERGELKFELARVLSPLMVRPHPAVVGSQSIYLSPSTGCSAWRSTHDSPQEVCINRL